MGPRDLPSVDRLLAEAEAEVATHGRALTTEALRDVLAGARARLLADGDGAVAPGPAELIGQASARLAAITAPSLRPVINATGVILHTNLGRAPLSEAAIAHAQAVARGFSTLEYDLQAGERGSRADHAEALLTRVTGAEAGLVVNNNAAAVLLILSALARDRAVLISRGQLVEIGGGFRVPDVLRESGARLVEVGTTNRTHQRDYQAALDESVALILRAHHSNFKMVGFTSEPSLAELCSLGRPVADDLGSGALLDTAGFGLAHEPMVQESVAAGAAVVAFSGDKLLGGPQAGLIVGQREYVERLKRHPLARAVRADKLCLAALTITLLHYARHEAVHKIPVWRMIALPVVVIEQRAQAWAARVAESGIETAVVDGESTVGGGSLPGETLPTRLLALRVPSPDALAARLRAQNPPIVTRVANGQVLLDPRTVGANEETALLRGIAQAIHELNE
jgi:L-seryl-tRNA(Ser) seleniumtransferase